MYIFVEQDGRRYFEFVNYYFMIFTKDRLMCSEAYFKILIRVCIPRRDNLGIEFGCVTK